MTAREAKCDVCSEAMRRWTCHDCGKQTCEECGRSLDLGAGTVRAREVWQCIACEFGGVP